MSSFNGLEISGNLTDHPLAEILIELLDARLDGSLRLSAHNAKAIIYVRDGEVVFAVSNQRRHRTFQLLLDAGLVTKHQLIGIPDFTNDRVLFGAAAASGIVTDDEIRNITKRQVEAVVVESLGWRDGSWTFSALAKLKEDVRVSIDIFGMLTKHARELPREQIVRRFKSLKETFGRRPTPPSNINLNPREAFLLSRFESGLLCIDELIALTGLPDAETLHGLYSLWISGFVSRSGYAAAISQRRASELLSAKLELKKEIETIPAAAVVEKPKPVDNPATPEPAKASQPEPPPKREISLEAYLSQVERSETHYETLNVSLEAQVAEIKQAYFTLAKRFHPDLFHRNTDAETQRRVQDAFTQIAHAYETLRNEESRLRYNYRLKSILDELRRQGKAGIKSEKTTDHKNLTEASEIFDHGFNLLMQEDYEGALPYLTRAVSMAPDVARYHAYFGKVLSADRSQKFKAEQELQTAIKLDPENPTFRLMLAEFFIDFNLLKRAEGELNRLLTSFPDNSEARALLDSLR